MITGNIDKELLIDYSIKMARAFIKESKEFYPFASAIDMDGKLVPILNFDGDEFPDRLNLLLDLTNILNTQLEKLEKRSYAIGYNVIATKGAKKMDALAIKIKHVESAEIVIYYFSYVLKKDYEIDILDSWGEIEPVHK